MAHEELSPLNITPGAIRFNTDSMKLEYFRIGMEGGSTSSYAGIGTMATGEWVQLTTDSPDIQTGGTRAVFAGGYNTGTTNNEEIEYVNIDSTGNSIDFGTLADAIRSNNGLASRTRGLSFGGQNPGPTSGGFVNIIEFVTIASTGNAANFGDVTAMSSGGGWATGVSNGTRGVLGGMYLNGHSPSVITEHMDYLTIAQTGNTVNFGDLSVGRVGGVGTIASSTRGIWAGGDTNAASYTDQNIIDFIVIATLGTAADFGDLTLARNQIGGASNSVRGLFAGGYNNPGTSTANNLIDYVTIATLGNAQDFGDLTVASSGTRGAASPTRGVFTHWVSAQSNNVIEYVQIMSTGNAIDFGDISPDLGIGAVFSNGHGGLG